MAPSKQDEELRRIIAQVYAACRAQVKGDAPQLALSKQDSDEKLKFLLGFLTDEQQTIANRCKAGGALVALRKHYYNYELMKAMEYFAVSPLATQICLVQGIVSWYSVELNDDNAEILMETLFSALQQQDLVFHSFTCLLALLSPADYEQRPAYFSQPEVLHTVLHKLLGFWDSPLYYVATLVTRIFQCIVDTWTNEELQEQIGQQQQRQAAMSAFVDELWCAPMTCKGALRFWCVLAVHLDEIKLIGLCSRLVDALDANYTSSCAASLFKVIGHTLAQRDKLDQLAHIFPDMCNKMRNQSQLSQQNFCNLLLPIYVSVDKSFQFHSRALPDANDPNANFFDMQCWACLAKSCKLLGRLPRCAYRDLRRALIHCDEMTRITALEVLCLTNKPGQQMSLKSLKLILEFLSLNMNSNQPPFRQRLIACFRSVCQQVKDGCIQMLPELRRKLDDEPMHSAAGVDAAVTDQLLPDISVAAWITQFDSSEPEPDYIIFDESYKPQSDELCNVLLENVRELAKYVRQLLTCDLWFPGSCYQRQKTAVELLNVICSHYFGNVTGLKKRGYSSEILEKVTEFLRDAFTKFGAGMSGNEGSAIASRLLFSAMHCIRDIQDSLVGIVTEYFYNVSLPANDLQQLQQLINQRCHSVHTEEFNGAGHVLAFLLRFNGSSTSGLQFCIESLANTLAAAKADPLAASAGRTGHGHLLAASLLLRTLPNTELHGQLFESATTVLLDLLSCLLTIMGSDVDVDRDEQETTAPSFAELGMAISRAAGVDGELDETLCATRLSAKYQRVLAWSWRSVKLISTLLVDLCSANLRCKDHAERRVPKVQQIGQRLADVVLRTRHRGTIESVATALRSFCQLARWSDGLQSCSAQLLNSPLVAMETGNYSVTRRSAGLPLLLTSVLAAVSAGQWTDPLVDSVVARLLQCINAKVDSSENVDSPKVHALNLLRALVRESGISNAMTRHHEPIVRATLHNFTDQSWAVRNSCVQLLGSLSHRMLGVGRPHISPAEFFAAYPRLLRLFSCILNIGNSTDLLQHQATVPVLSFLSKLSPDLPTAQLPSTEALRQPIVSLLSSPVYAVRLLAAKSHLALAPKTVRLDLLSAQIHNLSSLHRNANSLHGHLLLCQQLAQNLTGQPDLSVILSALVDLLLILITAKSWFLARECLKLLRLLVKRQDPCVTLNLPNTLAPSCTDQADIFFDLFDQELTELSMENPNIFANIRWDPAYLFKSLSVSSVDTTRHFLTQQENLKGQRMKMALSGMRGTAEETQKAVCSPQDVIGWAMQQMPADCLDSKSAFRVLSMLVTHNQGFFSEGFLKEYLEFVSERLRSLPSDCASEYFSSLILIQSHLINTLVDADACGDLLSYVARFADYSISEDLRLAAANSLLTVVSGKMRAQGVGWQERIREILFKQLFDESSTVRVVACSIAFRCGWLPALSHHRISGLALAHPIIADKGAVVDCDWLVRKMASIVAQLLVACNAYLDSISTDAMYTPEESNLFVEWRYLLELCFYKLYLSLQKLTDEEKLATRASLQQVLSDSSPQWNSETASDMWQNMPAFYSLRYAHQLSKLLLQRLG